MLLVRVGGGRGDSGGAGAAASGWQLATYVVEKILAIHS